MAKINPFITNGYYSEAYFCDRIEETIFLTRQVTNGNNVALISPCRLGKNVLNGLKSQGKQIWDTNFLPSYIGEHLLLHFIPFNLSSCNHDRHSLHSQDDKLY